MKRLLSVFLCVGLLFSLCGVGALADGASPKAKEELFERFADEASLLRLFDAFAAEGEHYSLNAVTAYVELKADFSPYGRGEDYGYVYEYYQVPAAVYEAEVARFFQLDGELIADLRAFKGGLWNEETQDMEPLYDESIDCYVFHGKGGLGDSARYRTWAYHEDGEAENRYVVYFHELEPGYTPEWNDVSGEDFLLDFADDGELYCYEITGLAKFVMEYDGTDVKFISSEPIETMPTPADWTVQESVEGFVAGQFVFGKVDGGEALWICRFLDPYNFFEVPAEVNGLPVTGLSGQLLANPENLKSITLPEGLTRIGADAFYGCENLTEITLPKGLTYIGAGAFWGCENLTGITLPEGLTNLGADAFYYCENLTEIHLPDTLETIGSWAFAVTGITQVTIPAGVTEIGEYAFDSLTDIQVAAGNTAFAVEDGVLYTADKTRILFGLPGKVGEGYDIPAGVTTIDRAAFSEVTGLGEITIPDSVTQMGDWAFALSDLTAVTLSKGLKEVPLAAFLGCTNLRQATIPEGVETIGIMAFCETALEEVTLPSTLRRIEDNAFAGTLLTEAVLPEGVEYIGDEVFYGCEKLERLVLPASLKTLVWYNRGQTGALKEVRFMGTEAQWDEVTVLGDRDLLDPLMVFSDSEPDGGMLGDVDGDGKITSTDARLVLQLYIGKIHKLPVGKGDFSDFETVADVDRDGAITSTDARLILQYYAGKITEFPDKTVFYIEALTESGSPATDGWADRDGKVVYVDTAQRLCVYENGIPTTRSVTWESSHPERIAVDANGYITGFESGKSARITATLEDGRTVSQLIYSHYTGELPDFYAYLCLATDLGEGVFDYIPCERPLDISLKETSTLQFVVMGRTFGFPFEPYGDWHAEGEGVASIDENGLVTLHGTGTAYIRVPISNDVLVGVQLNISE